MADYRTYDSIFEKASKTYGVDKSLLLGVAKTESNFNKNAVSSVGAKGIMQLMDGTAKSLGVTDSFNPEQNIMGGAKYLSQLLNQFNGNTDSALASYFAGSGNVKKYGAKKYSSYYNKVYKNQAEIKKLDDTLGDALDNLEKNAKEKIKESDEKTWGKDTSIAQTIVTVTFTILLAIGGIVFIALSIGGATGINKKLKTIKDIKNGKLENVSRETIDKNATQKIDKMISEGKLDADSRNTYIEREIKHQTKRSKGGKKNGRRK